MIERLFVIVGAGASHGCAPEDVEKRAGWAPPVVSTLFSAHPRLHYHEVLQNYPLAQLAAAELSNPAGSVAIEETLRVRYRDSEHDLDKRIFLSVAPFLQDLLHTVSDKYTRFPQHYQALVATLLRLPEVVFVTLNYDTILDRVLQVVDRHMSSMDWYVRPDRNWSLIKLHGSVNWVRQFEPQDDQADAFVDPPIGLNPYGGIMLRQPDEELWRMRGYSHGSGSRGSSFTPGKLLYPVLSVPVGTADELSCPDQHSDFLLAKMTDTQPLDLLFLGYSAHDQEVINLIAQSGRGIRSITVVDHREESARGICDRLRDEYRLDFVEHYPYVKDFGHWVREGGMHEAMERWTNA